ncbi:MAG: helix-turn-helix domain-containing protein [Clostridiaceae bacterium]|nr:helix-turn-helix domain-containing protein [Clostridiaceae bacterium]
MFDELWTPEEVAERWKVKPRTVREMLIRGEIKGTKIRNSWRVYLSEITRYEESRDNTNRRTTQTIAPMPKPVITRIV